MTTLVGIASQCARKMRKSPKDPIDNQPSHELTTWPSPRGDQSCTDRTDPRGREQLTAELQTDVEEQEGGRQAWIVVAGASTFFFVTLGLVYSFGIIQDELISRGFASSSTLGWVSSMTVVQMPILAIPTTKLVLKIGNRKVGLLGALLVSGGYFLTSWSFHSLAFLFVAQSIFGLGYAVMFWATNSIAASYFVRKRALATGIVYSASGIGGAVCSLAMQGLIKRLGLEWSVRIFGIIAFCLLIPASFTLIPKDKTVRNQAAFRLSLFKDFRFNMLLLATGLATFPLFVPPFFLPTYASSAGLSKETGAWLVAGYNLASAAGRLVFGVVADSRVGPVTSLLIAMILSSFSIMAIWTVSSSLAVLVIAMILNGSSSGALLSLQPPVNAAVFGLQETALTMSMLTSSRAFGSALGGPIAGYLLDAFGGPSSGTKAYRPALLVMGAICLLSALFVGLLRFRLTKELGWKARV